MTSAKRYITSRQLQKLSSDGPRNSARPAMPRWNAWLCRFGMRRQQHPRALVAGEGRGVGLDMHDAALLDRNAHVPAPTLRRQRPFGVDMEHGSLQRMSKGACIGNRYVYTL